jgi:hypothetical protein
VVASPRHSRAEQTLGRTRVLSAACHPGEVEQARTGAPVRRRFVRACCAPSAKSLASGETNAPGSPQHLPGCLYRGVSRSAADACGSRYLVKARNNRPSLNRIVSPHTLRHTKGGRDRERTDLPARAPATHQSLASPTAAQPLTASCFPSPGNPEIPSG